MPEDNLDFLDAYSEEFGKDYEGGAAKELQLPEQITKFISHVLKDFVHYTVLVVFLKYKQRVFTIGEIAKEVHEPKRTIKAVLQHFAGEGFVRKTGGFFTRYVFDRELSRWNTVLYSFQRLLTHREARSLIIKQVVIGQPDAGGGNA